MAASRARERGGGLPLTGPTDEGWLYLVVFLDLYSRAVVGWSMKEHMQANLVTDALRMAYFRRRPPAGLIVHSDRGSTAVTSSRGH